MAQEKKKTKDRVKKPEKSKPRQSGDTMKGAPKPWLTVFLLLILAYLIFEPLFHGDRITISYTKFKEEVKSENVKKITMEGREITGTFKEEIKKPGMKAGDDKKIKKYGEFKTITPPVKDPDLLPLLEEKGISITSKEGEGAWWNFFLIFLLPWIIILGFYMYSRGMMSRQMGRGGFGGFFNIGKSRAKRFDKSMSQIRFDDVAGLDNPKKDLKEIVEYLTNPERFNKLGARIPRGLLLFGPPGTGKTLLARATAGEADVPFFSISGSEFIEMFVGIGASRVRDMFSTAKKESPSIIFIDEIDSIGRTRGSGLGGGHDEREQTLNQILSEMDGFAPHESVIVIAATNRPDVLDPALTRPGRFDRHITLNLPPLNIREKILAIHTKKVPLKKNVDLNSIAGQTVGLSGADLQNMVNEAALLAGRKKKTRVGQEEFDEARDKIMLGLEREDILDDEDREIIAYHESGHALITKILPGVDPLRKVTIIPRGMSLGATEQAPEKDRYNVKKNYLLNKILILLGGRASEKLIFNEMTTGAANDLQEATKTARRIITQFGMNENIGPATFIQNEDHVFLGKEITRQKNFSEKTTSIIDEEVINLMKKLESRALNILQENISRLKKLASALIEKETLDNAEIDELLGFDSQKRNN